MWMGAVKVSKIKSQLLSVQRKLYLHENTAGIYSTDTYEYRYIPHLSCIENSLPSKKIYIWQNALKIY